MMQVASLQPELEFEVIKLVLLREKYLGRLKRVLDESGGRIDLTVVGLFDTLRDASLSTVETIHNWEQSQVDYPLIKPFLWNGQNYLCKMVEDISFLAAYSQVSSWLEFPSESSPFFLPPELLLSETMIALKADTFVMFGKRPEIVQTKFLTAKKNDYRSMKSPYNTKIINDPDIFPSLSLENRLNAIMKGKKKNVDESKKEHCNIYETMIGASVVTRARFCWNVLCDRNPHLALQRTKRKEDSLRNSTSRNDFNQLGTANRSVDFNLTSSTSERAGNEMDDSDIDQIPTQIQGRFNQIPTQIQGPFNQIPTQIQDPSEDQSDLFLQSQKQFQLSIQQSANNLKNPFGNESMRISLLSSTQQNIQNQNLDLDSTISQSMTKTKFGEIVSTDRSRTGYSTRLWTPHEIVLQKAIERRGKVKEKEEHRRFLFNFS